MPLFLAAAAGAFVDPITWIVMIWPGLLQRRWWPVALLAVVFAGAAGFLTGDGTYDATYVAPRLAAALAVGTLAWLIRYGVTRHRAKA